MGKIQHVLVFPNIALPQCNNLFLSQKITVDHATVYFELMLRGLYWVIYISFILSCAIKVRRYFYELLLGCGEAHHG